MALLAASSPAFTRHDIVQLLVWRSIVAETSPRNSAHFLVTVWGALLHLGALSWTLISCCVPGSLCYTDAGTTTISATTIKDFIASTIAIRDMMGRNNILQERWRSVGGRDILYPLEEVRGRQRLSSHPPPKSTSTGVTIRIGPVVTVGALTAALQSAVPVTSLRQMFMTALFDDGDMTEVDTPFVGALVSPVILLCPPPPEHAAVDRGIPSARACGGEAGDGRVCRAGGLQDIGQPPRAARSTLGRCGVTSMRRVGCAHPTASPHTGGLPGDSRRCPRNAYS